MKIFSIPAGPPFLDQLAQRVLDGSLPVAGGTAPALHDLPRTTILLPNRRACRALENAFLKVSGRQTLILPRIRPIGDGDEEADLIGQLTFVEAGQGDPTVMEIPASVSRLERQLALSQLVMAWARAQRAGLDAEAPPTVASAGAATAIATPAQAASLANELAGLVDMLETEQVSLDRLADIVPDNLATHWRQTLDFLTIVTEFWPSYLVQAGKTSPADRRNRLLQAVAERLMRDRPADPIIVAGVTGSIPATVSLMRAVASLPAGAIVLPALDLDLDDESWTAIAPRAARSPGDRSMEGNPAHPQFGLKTLLTRLDVDRGDVIELAEAEKSNEVRTRARFVGEALRPPATTNRWSDITSRLEPDAVRTALSGVTLLEADTGEMEAEIISLILRRAAEEKGRTAALVSPDRILARRVATRLQAWGINVDDSAGRPFGKTVTGAFLDLVIEVVKQRFRPAALLSMLKHPLCRTGLSVKETRLATRALEILAFRGPYLGDGLVGVVAALDRASEQAGGEAIGRLHPAARRLTPDQQSAARDLVARLAQIFQPFLALEGKGTQASVAEFAQAHIATAEALGAATRNGGAGLWEREAGEAGSRFFAELLEPSLPHPVLGLADYPEFYRALVAGIAVRTNTAVHPRLTIWGPFESRLQQTDIVILGGLNEGVWPKQADADAWLGRQMLAELGLPMPEEAIGHSAHDFTHLLAAPRVYLTRAARVDGVPSVPSRWIQRMQALLRGLDIEDALLPAADEPWLGWARNRDWIATRRPVAAPQPRPALAARPRQLSVTRIEAWLANPYAIFAGDILNLTPLPPVGTVPDIRIRGEIIHRALHLFTRAAPDALPDDAERQLAGLAGELLNSFRAHPAVAAFWEPRFERFAKWFIETEIKRRQNVARICTEITGRMVLEDVGAPFVLTARADRIDACNDGRLVIYDYKTGTPPSAKRVVDGLSPQLPLEAAMAHAGAFAGLPPAEVSDLVYIAASGGQPPGLEQTHARHDPAKLATDALDGLKTLIRAFNDPAVAYRAVRRPGFDGVYRYDDYAHLARVAEWSASDDA